MFQLSLCVCLFVCLSVYPSIYLCLCLVICVDFRRSNIVSRNCTHPIRPLYLYMNVYIHIYITNSYKFVVGLDPHTGNVFVLIYSVGVQHRDEFINSVGVQRYAMLLSAHWDPKDPNGIQSSLYVCLYVSLSIRLVFRVAFFRS